MGSVEDLSLDEWRRGMSVNADSVFLGCKYALPLMRESQPGSIVNISSIAGLIAAHNFASLQRFEGGGLAADQIGGAALRAQRLEHPLQLDASDLHPHADSRIP